MTHNETLIGETPLHQYPPKQKPDKTPKLLENLVLSDVSTFFILTFLLPTSAQNARCLKPRKTEFFLTSSQRVPSAKETFDKGQGHPSESKGTPATTPKKEGLSKGLLIIVALNKALLGPCFIGGWHWRPPQIPINDA